MVPNSIAPFPTHLASWIEEEGISIWYSVPSVLTRLLLHGELERFEYESLRAVLFAGEVFPVKFLRGVLKRLRHARFFNLYGPTETNVCTYHPLPQSLDRGIDRIPIGKACAGTDVFALNDQGRVAASHETGELCVRGPTVMLGYWDLTEKTAEVLQPDPRAPDSSALVYRTGDVVRVGAGGEFHFVGRSDRQVKSRGYRIELGEIEHTLLRHEQVEDAVVLAVPDDELGTTLKAVLTPSSTVAPTRSELVKFCGKYLPPYMVPDDFVICDELPRTSTGKVDRLALEVQLGHRPNTTRS
jgi:acyl-coenzyme A synthetase/AMP-(fatty) acid ligase